MGDIVKLGLEKQKDGTYALWARTSDPVNGTATALLARYNAVKTEITADGKICTALSPIRS